MEEGESFTEHLEEEMHEVASRTREHWLKLSALMSAIFAVLAAIATLESGHAANKAMLEQIEAANSWSYYQAKGIKAMIAEMKPSPEAAEKVEKYHAEQQTIQEEAKGHSAASEQSLKKHEVLARAVTLLQIAIAMTAIAVMTRQRMFLFVSLALGIGGAFFLLQGWGL